MAKKKKRQSNQTKQQPVQQKKTNVWMITTIAAVILLIGVSAKTMFSPRENARSMTPIQSTPGPITIQPKTLLPASTTLAANSVEDQVFQVAVNFKCACGGCGELPLAECQCDMVKGAVEEKSFIRTKLGEGYTVPEVIELVDQKYGHRA